MKFSYFLILTFEIAAGGADEVLGEPGQVLKLTFLGGAFSSEEDFVVADGQIIEQIFLFTQGFQGFGMGPIFIVTGAFVE